MKNKGKEEEFFIKTKDGRFKSARNEKELTEDSDIKNNTLNQKSVMADLFEDIIGAVVVDSDWNYEKISNVCSNMLKLKKFDINYIKWVKNYCDESPFMGLTSPVQIVMLNSVKPGEPIERKRCKYYLWLS